MYERYICSTANKHDENTIFIDNEIIFMDFHFMFDYCSHFHSEIPSQHLKKKKRKFRLWILFYEKSFCVLFCYVLFFRFLLFSKKSTYARMISIKPDSLLIIGSFKKQTVDPDFKVNWTTFFFGPFTSSIKIRRKKENGIGFSTSNIW